MPGKNVDNMPTTWEQARDRLGDRYERTIANNTSIRRRSTAANTDAYEIVLHSTAVVTFYPPVVTADETVRMVRLNSGGYRSVTTKARMNACLFGTPYAVIQRDFSWYVANADLGFATRDFEDEMLLDVS